SLRSAPQFVLTQAPTALASCEHSSLRNPPAPTSSRTRVHDPASAKGPCLSTHTYRLPIVKERDRNMGSLRSLSSDRLPCRANAFGRCAADVDYRARADKTQAGVVTRLASPGGAWARRRSCRASGTSTCCAPTASPPD